MCKSPTPEHPFCFAVSREKSHNTQQDFFNARQHGWRGQLARFRPGSPATAVPAYRDKCISVECTNAPSMVRWENPLSLASLTATSSLWSTAPHPALLHGAGDRFGRYAVALGRCCGAQVLLCLPFIGSRGRFQTSDHQLCSESRTVLSHTRTGMLLSRSRCANHCPRIMFPITSRRKSTCHQHCVHDLRRTRNRRTGFPFDVVSALSARRSPGLPPLSSITTPAPPQYTHHCAPCSMCVVLAVSWHCGGGR